MTLIQFVNQKSPYATDRIMGYFISQKKQHGTLNITIEWNSFEISPSLSRVNVTCVVIISGSQKLICLLNGQPGACETSHLLDLLSSPKLEEKKRELGVFSGD